MPERAWGFKSPLGHHCTTASPQVTGLGRLSFTPETGLWSQDWSQKLGDPPWKHTAAPGCGWTTQVFSRISVATLLAASESMAGFTWL